jgi:hypothetical protein
MEEIKRRVEVIAAFQAGRANALYEPTQIESVYLQIRKILELIALGSLVANRDALSKILTNVAHHWNAKKMFKDIKRVNPDFYPHAIVESPSQQPGIVSDVTPRTDGVLNKTEFVHLYEKCGAILHAANPFARGLDYDAYWAEVPQWLSKIMALLGSHQIHLVGDTGSWLIHMNEERDDKVHYYRFERVEPAA